MANYQREDVGEVEEEATEPDLMSTMKGWLSISKTFFNENALALCNGWIIKVWLGKNIIHLRTSMVG